MIKNLCLIFIVGFLFGILNLSDAMMLNISTDKAEYYTTEEINISITIIPSNKGVYGYVYLSKINGSIENLVYYPRGCSACGLKKSPLTSTFHKKFNKKFEEEGIYEIYGEIEDAESYEKNFTALKIIVKEKNKANKAIEKNITNNTTKKAANAIINITTTNITKDAKENATKYVTKNLTYENVSENKSVTKEAITSATVNLTYEKEIIWEKIKTTIIYFLLHFFHYF